MSTKISLEYFGMPGEGATVAQAKQDAGRKLESLVADAGTIYHVRIGDESVIVCRNRLDWQYGFLRDGTGRINCCNVGFPTLRSAVESAAVHLASNVYPRGATNPASDDATLYFDALKPYIADANALNRAVANLCDRASWQRRYAEARLAGLSDNDCREYAEGRRPLTEE